MWKGFRVFGKTFEAVLGGTIGRNPGHGILFHLKFRTYVYCYANKAFLMSGGEGNTYDTWYSF